MFSIYMYPSIESRGLTAPFSVPTLVNPSTMNTNLTAPPSGFDQERIVRELEGAQGMPLIDHKYFVVPAVWYSSWKQFCSSGAPLPGPIITSPLADEARPHVLKSGLVRKTSTFSFDPYVSI